MCDDVIAMGLSVLIYSDLYPSICLFFLCCVLFVVYWAPRYVEQFLADGTYLSKYISIYLAISARVMSLTLPKLNLVPLMCEDREG